MKLNRNIRIAFAALVMFIAASSAVSAQQISMDVQPRAIRLNETATLTLNFININPPQAPALPAINGFDIRHIGQEQHFQITNNQQERRLTYNYQLVPSSTGTFEVGPFAIDMNGHRIELAAVTVEVLPPSGNAGGGEQTMSDLIFAKIQLPRPEVYLQERFDVELSLYYQGVQIDRGVQLQNLPGTGLNLDEFEEIGSTREVVNNQIYEVRRFRLRGTAISSGSFELAPMVRVNVLVRRERQRDPFFGGFDDFFLGRHQTQPVTVPAEPMTVTIRSLPAEGRPDGFGGAVGQFDMQAEIQPAEVTAGEPVTITLRITGRGNFETISMPAMDFGDGFRRYDPKLISAGRDHKFFEQVFIPRTDSITEIPPVRFSFFNPESGSYQTITRGPYPLLVKAGAAPSDLQLVQAPSLATAPDRAPLGIDIIDLKRNFTSGAENPAEAVKLSAPLHILPLFALVGLFVFQKRRESFQSDISRQRRSQAPRSARKALKAAEGALGRQDVSQFYQSLWQSIADYTAHRCNLQAGQISPELILQKSKAGGLPVAQQESLEQILRECDEARFAAGGFTVAELPSRLQRTQEILRALEKIKLS